MEVTAKRSILEKIECLQSQRNIVLSDEKNLGRNATDNLIYKRPGLME